MLDFCLGPSWTNPVLLRQYETTGDAGRCEQNSEANVGVTHEVRAIAHEIGDVVGITKEILADDIY